MTGWIPQPPRPISPAPAAGRDDLRGRRVLVGHPGHGWRGDLRADAAVVQGARTYIPVLTEQEWYRAELEQMEAFAPLVPVDRVWVETLGEPVAGEDIPGDLFERLVSLDTPALRYPVSARLVSGLSGRRVATAGRRSELQRLTVRRRRLDEYDNSSSSASRSWRCSVLGAVQPHSSSMTR